MPGLVYASIQYTGLSGTLAATADFELTGSTLTVTLTNTSAADTTIPENVLTGVFFNTTSVLTPVSANLNGSTTHFGAVVNNVGEGWQYKSGVNAQGKNSGLSAAGLDIFGPNGNFFSPAVKVNGLGYGILSAGDNLGTYNGGFHGPLVKNSVQFLLTAASGFSLNELGNSVVFQYGTSITEPHFMGTSVVPEVTSITVWSLLVGLAAFLSSRSK